MLSSACNAAQMQHIRFMRSLLFLHLQAFSRQAVYQVCLQRKKLATSQVNRAQIKA